MIKWTLVLMISSAVIYAVLWNFVDSASPDNWDKIHIGMTREEVDYVLLNFKYEGFPEEALMTISFPKKYTICDPAFNKWRSKNAWFMQVEFDSNAEFPKGGWKVYPVEHQKDKLIRFEKYKWQEAWFDIFSFPWIGRTFHS